VIILIVEFNLCLYLVLLQSKKPYGNSLKVHFLLSYDALKGSFVEQCVLS
jgi:hypothetical protein